MAKPNKQSSKENYDKKTSEGMVKRSLWTYPNQWEAIKAYADKKTDRERLLREES